MATPIGVQNEAVRLIIPKVIYAQTAYEPNIQQAIDNAKKIGAFVDTCLIVTDVQPLPDIHGITFAYHEWVDDIVVYCNHVLDEARKLEGDYLLFSDPDEHFNDAFLAGIKSIILTNPQFNGFELYTYLNINNFATLDEGTQQREAPGGVGADSNAWKLMLFKIEPLTKYLPQGTSEKCIHHSVRGSWNIIKLPKRFYFTHDKEHTDVWASSVRNIFICGGGDNVGANNPLFVELHKKCDALGITTWRQFVDYCKKGNIDSGLKELILQYRSDDTHDYSSEIRDLFHWYFDYLHPEENNGYKSKYSTNSTPESLTERYVQKTYFEVLGRHTDLPGKQHYVNGILTGDIIPDNLPQMIRESDEYVRNHINTTTFDIMGRGATEVEQKVWGDLIKAGHITNFPSVAHDIMRFTQLTLAYCQMTYKHDLEITIQNVIDAKPYVDICIVVYDDSLEADDIARLIKAGARAKYHKWYDNFPRQRNNYLQEARAFGATWVLVSDPDEHFDKVLLENARALVKQGEQIGASMFLVNAHDIFTDDEQGKPRENPPEHIPDYAKNLFYKLLPEAFYVGVGETQNLHENLMGNFRAMKLPKEFFYRHVKSHVEIWQHSARNIFVGGGGMNMGFQIPQYKEFVAIVKEQLGFTTWYQFREYLKAGNIAPKLAEFIKNNRNNYGHDYDSEYRELFMWYYYTLHPEENHENLKIEVNDQGPAPKPVDDVEDFVDECYRKILRRDADAPGKMYYSREIKDGRIKKEQLLGILQASEEYRAIVGSDAIRNISMRA